MPARPARAAAVGLHARRRLRGPRGAPHGAGPVAVPRAARRLDRPAAAHRGARGDVLRRLAGRLSARADRGRQRGRHRPLHDPGLGPHPRRPAHRDGVERQRVRRYLRPRPAPQAGPRRPVVRRRAGRRRLLLPQLQGLRAGHRGRVPGGDRRHQRRSEPRPAAAGAVDRAARRRRSAPRSGRRRGSGPGEHQHPAAPGGHLSARGALLRRRRLRPGHRHGAHLLRWRPDERLRAGRLASHRRGQRAAQRILGGGRHRVVGRHLPGRAARRDLPAHLHHRRGREQRLLPARPLAGAALPPTISRRRARPADTR